MAARRHLSVAISCSSRPAAAGRFPEDIPDATFCPSSKGGKDKCGKSKCGKFGKCGDKYWEKESGKGGKFKCAKHVHCTNDCSEGFINYESCNNCRNKEEVCAEHNEEDEDCDEDEE